MDSKLLQTAGDQLLRIDDGARKVFEPLANSPAIEALNLLSKFGDQPELRLISGGLLVAGTMIANDRLVRAGARMLIAHEAATALKDLLKTNIDRTRPRSAQKSGAKKPEKGHQTAKEKTSFPSGHSAGAIAAARAFSREFPQYGMAAICAATAIAAAQIPRCAHYPTDVAAGILIGLLMEEATNLAWKAGKMDERSTDRSPSNSRAGAANV